jgi:DNA-binding NtrC family response regulator
MNDGSRARVLVVEDRASVLKLIATILEPAYEVTTASDGTTALALLGSAPFDVVLTDVRMPGASGFDVLRAARTRSPGTSVVMMTAYANVPDAVAAIKLGACDYVAKPVDADELALAVARAVEQRREEAGADVGEALEEPPLAADVSVGFRRAVEVARDDASRRYLVRLMRAFQGNVTRAAAQAGMTRESLHRVLKRYDVRSETYKEASELEGRPGSPGRGKSPVD